jgi:hypothetical protein
MKVILNLRFDGVVAVKGCPLKKVFWISAGASFATAGFAGAAAGAGAAATDTVNALKAIPAEIAPAKDFGGEDLCDQDARSDGTHGKPPKPMIRKSHDRRRT